MAMRFLRGIGRIYADAAIGCAERRRAADAFARAARRVGIGDSRQCWGPATCPMYGGLFPLVNTFRRVGQDVAAGPVGADIAGGRYAAAKAGGQGFISDLAGDVGGA